MQASVEWRMSISFTCSCCGQNHEGFPALTFRAPANWDWANEEQRAQDWKLDEDLCAFKDVDFYIRAVLVLPIRGSEQTLEFGVWSTLSKDNFWRYVETFNDDDQSKLGSMFGWFSNAIPGYADTLNMKCQVVTQDHRQRPRIELEPTDHPLSVHQREGVSMEDAQRYYHAHIVRN